MTDETVRAGLAVVATCLHVYGYVIYNRQTKRGTSTPNASTWTIWSVVTVMNSGAYLTASGDLLTSVLPAVSGIACVLTFMNALRHGRFKRPRLWDVVAMVLGLAAGVVWWRFDDPFVASLILPLAPAGASAALVANLILQLATGISFIPTYRDAWFLRSESPPPWVIWSVAYLLLIVAVWLRVDEQRTDYIYPVQGILMHATVIPIAILANRRR